MVFPCPVLVPAKLEAQKLKAGLRCWGLPTEGNDPRLLGRELQPELPQSLAQHRVEAFGLWLPFKCTNEIVCVPDQTCLSSTLMA